MEGLQLKVLSSQSLSRLKPVLQKNGVSIKKLKTFIDATEAELENSLHPEGLSSLLDKALENVSEAGLIQQAIVQLATAYDRLSLSIDEGVEAISDGKFLPGSDELAAARDVATIARTSCVRNAVKMGWLAYDHSAYIHESQVIVDLRPVFCETTKKANAFIVLGNFQFVATDKYGTRSRSYVIDKDEIVALRKACESALDQIDALQSMVLNKLEADVYLPGEEPEPEGAEGRNDSISENA